MPHEDRANDVYWDAVAVRQDPLSKKTYWTRVGRGYANRDGSYNIYLDALPTSGKLQLRLHKDKAPVLEGEAR